jgi:hypothetical protein
MFREIDENAVGPACLTGMRDGICDPGWRVPFGNLERISGIESGNGTKELAGTMASSLQALDAGKKATPKPCFNRSRLDLGADLTHHAGTFIVGGVPNAGEPTIPRRSPGWIGAKNKRTQT